MRLPIVPFVLSSFVSLGHCSGPGSVCEGFSNPSTLSTTTSGSNPSASGSAALTVPSACIGCPVNSPPSANPTSTGNTGCREAAPCSGEATYYDTATSLAAPSSCGTVNDGDNENIVALSQHVMTDDLCGKTVTVTYGDIVRTGTIGDKCMGCATASIDLSRHFFEQFGNVDEGRLDGIAWYVNE